MSKSSKLDRIVIALMTFAVIGTGYIDTASAGSSKDKEKDKTLPPTNTPAPPTNKALPPTNTPAPLTNTPAPSTNTPAPNILDLTNAGSSGLINKALFQQVSDSNAAGTGKINSFLRIQALGKETSEQGYNTDYRAKGGDKLQFDENSSPNFTRSLLLSEIPVITIDGIKYRQFILDINEPNAKKQEKPLITLDKLQLFLGNSGSLFNYSPENGFGSNAYKIYDLDAGKDSQIALSDLNAGSGRYDMFTYIPDSVFTGPNEYVYLYSSFNGPDTQGGFEEWAVKAPSKPKRVPEPSALLALGLLVSGAFRIKKRKQTASICHQLDKL